MEKPENCNNTSASRLPEAFSSLISLLYAICYLIGARIIRYYRRHRRILKRTALHLKWAVRRFYFDIKDQHAAAAPSRGRWKRDLQKIISQTNSGLQDWNRQRKQPSAGLCLPQLVRALSPSFKLVVGAVNYILPLVGIIILTSTIYHFSTLTYGLQVQYNGQHMGYILSESDFDEAEAKVRERIVNEEYLPPEDSVPIFSLVIVEDDQISDQDVLINNIIREKTCCDEEIPGCGSFTYQLYADYRDELDDANIKQIFNSCDPKEAFLDLLMQGYDDAMWEDECEIVSTIMANLEETDVELDEDEIRQYVQENVCIELPEDHYLSQQVNVNIYLDTGDANYDFTLNTFGQCYYGDPEEPIDDKASLVWLAKTQGYTKEDLGKVNK